MTQMVGNFSLRQVPHPPHNESDRTCRDARGRTEGSLWKLECWVLSLIVELTKGKRGKALAALPRVLVWYSEDPYSGDSWQSRSSGV